MEGRPVTERKESLGLLKDLSWGSQVYIQQLMFHERSSNTQHGFSQKQVYNLKQELAKFF